MLGLDQIDDMLTFVHGAEGLAMIYIAAARYGSPIRDKAGMLRPVDELAREIMWTMQKPPHLRLRAARSRF